MEGAVEAGIRIGRVYADSAYDTVANWIVTRDNDIEFYPNLKKNFGEKVRSRKFDHMVLTMRWRYDLYMIRQGCICKVRQGLSAEA